MTNDAPIRSIKRVFDIVDVLVETPSAGVSAIAQQTDLPKSTVHSHLATLQELGLVTKEGRKYAATTKFLDIAGQQRQNLKIYQQARRIVDDLAMETGGYADLYIEEQGMGVLLHLATGGTTVELGFAYEGFRHPLHTNVSGKSILAFQPEDRVAEIIDAQRDSTEAVISGAGRFDEEVLFDELERIRKRKYAIDREEALVGMSGVGTPILNRDGNAVAGIAVYKPDREMSDSYFEIELPELVRKKANIIEVNLNYGT